MFFKLFYLVSLFFSYIIIYGGKIYFEPFMLFSVPLYALWLNVPIFSRNTENDKQLFYVILGYLFWVAIQWLIFYFGLGPPEGVGIPHFS